MSAFDACIAALLEAQHQANTVAEEMSNGAEFFDMIRDTIAFGREHCWAFTDADRAELATLRRQEHRGTL